MLRGRYVRLVFAATLGIAPQAQGQCEGLWTNTGLPTGVVASQKVALWDPDEVGPAEPRLVVAGTTLVTYGLRTGSQQLIGTFGPFSTIADMVPAGPGRIVLGGPIESFTPAGGPRDQEARILLLDGGGITSVSPRQLGVGLLTRFQWLPERNGIPGALHAVIGSTASVALFRLDGNTWTPLSGGAPGPPAGGLAALPDNTLVVGARSQTRPPGSLHVSWFSRHDAGSWAPLGALNLPVGTGHGPMVALADGSLIASLQFQQPVGGSRQWLYRYDPASGSWLPWAGLGATPVQALAALPEGGVVVGTALENSPLTFTAVSICRDGKCQRAGQGLNGSISSLLALPSGDIIAAGQIRTSPSFSSGTLARFTTRPSCLADWTCDARTGVDDIFIYLAGWFTGSPRFDIDGDQRLSVADLFGMLSAWFAGCSAP